MPTMTCPGIAWAGDAMQHAAASKKSGSGLANHDFFIGASAVKLWIRGCLKARSEQSMDVPVLVPVKTCSQRCLVSFIKGQHWQT